MSTKNQTQNQQSIESYDLNKRLTLSHNSQWLLIIDTLKHSANVPFDPDMTYTVVFRQSSRHSSEHFTFNSLQFVPDTSSFIFTSYQTDDCDNLTNDIRDQIVLKDIDIIDLQSTSYDADDPLVFF